MADEKRFLPAGKKLGKNAKQQDVDRWLCRYLGLHKPAEIKFDGFQESSTCEYCGKEILIDSQGNWF
jgi:hypothetical protein